MRSNTSLYMASVAKKGSWLILKSASRYILRYLWRIDILAFFCDKAIFFKSRKCNKTRYNFLQRYLITLMLPSWEQLLMLFWGLETSKMILIHPKSYHFNVSPSVICWRKDFLGERQVTIQLVNGDMRGQQFARRGIRGISYNGNLF